LDVFYWPVLLLKSNVEEESSPPYLKDAMTDLEEEMTNLEDTTSATTPQSTMGSNELNHLPMEPGSIQYVKKKVKQCI
jgi:hypothetical protein